MKMPWMQFHTRDWLDNKELRRCSVTARSILADLMCLAHEGEPYGYLCDKFGPLSDEFMAARCFVDLAEFRHAVIELVRFERVSEHDGKYFIKRMVEDFEVREKRAIGGKLGGNPNLKESLVEAAQRLKVNHEVKGKVNLPDDLAHTKEGLPLSDSDSGSGSSASMRKKQKEEESDNWFSNVFWPAWPVKENKDPAKKAARNIDPQDRGNAVAGILRQADRIKAQERPIHASTWLNNRRWEDEAHTPVTRQQALVPYESNTDRAIKRAYELHEQGLL